MTLFLGLFIFSFLLNAFLFVPFINLLYKISFQRRHQKTLDVFGKLTPIFDRFHGKKAGTPVGGGLLIIITTTILTFLFLILFHFFWVPISSDFLLKDELKIIFFTYVMFGLLGLFDDIKKMFPGAKDNFFGLRFRHKLFLQLILAFVVGFWLYKSLSITIVNVPFLGVFDLSYLYIPFAAFVIVAFANAYNITDGLDGLAGGLLFISLSVFWIISSSILDTPLTTFIAIWLGGLVAFLYFNVYPARIMLGDVGSLSFGATLAVIGLLLGKSIALVVIGGVFIFEVASSLVQIVSKKILGKKIFECAPLHLWLQHKGWEEPKIVMRAWLAAIMLGVFGLWLSAFT
jgi:phospho-N-acetylmuramoyl-pentapeptide-transferase